MKTAVCVFLIIILVNSCGETPLLNVKEVDKLHVKLINQSGINVVCRVMNGSNPMHLKDSEEKLATFADVQLPLVFYVDYENGDSQKSEILPLYQSDGTRVPFVVITMKEEGEILVVKSYE